MRPRPPISPAGAFVRSFVLPGWGQSRLNRNMSAGLFVAFEGVALAMTWKSAWQLEFARARGKHVESHEQELQDWIVLLFFNHLFSAAEAWVSANLYDFPEALNVRAMPAPGGGTTIGITVPLR